MPQAAEEIAAPFAADVDVGEAVWRAYVVEGEGQPRLVHQSERWLHTPIWADNDGPLTIPYGTRVVNPSDGSRTGFASGYIQVDLSSGATNWEHRSFDPDSWRLSPGGDWFLILDRTGPFGFQFPVLAGALYLHEPGGRTLKLEGFSAESLSWSPDGRFFTGSGYVAPDPNPQELTTATYLLEPERNQAVLIGVATFGHLIRAGWSPDGTRLAFVEGTDLVVFNVTARSRVVIPLGVELRGLPLWSADGRYVVIGRGAVDVTGQRVVLPPLARAVISTEISPDGSRIAVTSDPSVATADNPCPTQRQPFPNQTLLGELATGNQRTLLDCENGLHSEATWLGNDHLVLRSPICWACGGAESWIKLLTVSDGTLQDLTDGYENRGDYAVSPDGKRVLVSGSRLRLYAAGGELLRQIVVPPHARVTGIVWSPDGSSFAYVVGPRLDGS